MNARARTVQNLGTIMATQEDVEGAETAAAAAAAVAIPDKPRRARKPRGPSRKTREALAAEFERGRRSVESSPERMIGNLIALAGAGMIGVLIGAVVF